MAGGQTFDILTIQCFAGGIVVDSLRKRMKNERTGIMVLEYSILRKEYEEAVFHFSGKRLDALNTPLREGRSCIIWNISLPATGAQLPTPLASDVLCPLSI
jgi:uncharacterized protein YvpB